MAAGEWRRDGVADATWRVVGGRVRRGRCTTRRCQAGWDHTRGVLTYAVELPYSARYRIELVSVGGDYSGGEGSGSSSAGGSSGGSGSASSSTSSSASTSSTATTSTSSTKARNLFKRVKFSILDATVPLCELRPGDTACWTPVVPCGMHVLHVHVVGARPGFSFAAINFVSDLPMLEPTF